MTEPRLNNYMLLHIHKQLTDTDSCDLLEIAKKFVSAKIKRGNYFGTFTNTELL